MRMITEHASAAHAVVWTDPKERMCLLHLLSCRSDTRSSHHPVAVESERSLGVHFPAAHDELTCRRRMLTKQLRAIQDTRERRLSRSWDGGKL
jgi:hypothetical protein